MPENTEQHETIIITETSTDHPGVEVIEIIEAVHDPSVGPDDASHTVELHEFIVVEAGHTEIITEHIEHVDGDHTDAGSSVLVEDVSHPAGEEVAAAPEDAAAAQAAAEADAHAAAATEAQHQADEAVAAGDYAAAAEAREVAENEAWEAGHNDMLHGSSSADLSHAADHQEQASYYEQQEAQYAAEGNYEAAQDAASHATEATVAADYYASGADHSGQARAEEWQEGWAVHEQNQAEAEIHTAEYYANMGDADHAATHEALADEHMASADYHGDLGQHDGPMADHDPSSDVAHDTSHDVTEPAYDASHDAHTYDDHSYDA